MKQLALDIGLACGPSLRNFLAGPNLAVLQHLQLWVGNDKRSPVPSYVWGEPGSGKTHHFQRGFSHRKSGRRYCLVYRLGLRYT